MLATRFNTALGISITGVFLITAQFAMLSHASITHPLPRTILTSQDASDTGVRHSGAADCHEESAPKNQAPHNHDCCTVGHLHAIGSAQVSIVPSFVVTSADNSFIPSASLDQTASPARQTSDSGPPGSAVPIRV
ncbi:MAG TPA: hypothetical protein VFU50_03485 [Terriglobales bacterium]|nr:hypothetical protein [Terriglobales bacterium]